MTYFKNLKDQVRGNILNVNYAPPKNPIARIKYHTLIKEVITELYNDYLESPVKVYEFLTKVPYDLYASIVITPGWVKFAKRIHVSDFSLMTREMYGVYGVNHCTCDECMKVLSKRGLEPMDNTPYMELTSPGHPETTEYFHRKEQLAKMSKTERMLDSYCFNSSYGAMGSPKPVLIVGLENDLSEKIRDWDMKWIKHLKDTVPLAVKDLTCPHAKAMLFTKVKTKKGV